MNIMVYHSVEDLPLLITVPELAQVLRVGKNKAYELVNSGAIKGIKIGTQIKVPKRSVVEFMGI